MPGDERLARESLSFGSAAAAVKTMVNVPARMAREKWK